MNSTITDHNRAEFARCRDATKNNQLWWYMTRVLEQGEHCPSVVYSRAHSLFCGWLALGDARVAEMLAEQSVKPSQVTDEHRIIEGNEP